MSAPERLSLVTPALALRAAFLACLHDYEAAGERAPIAHGERARTCVAVITPTPRASVTGALRRDLRHRR